MKIKLALYGRLEGSDRGEELQVVFGPEHMDTLHRVFGCRKELQLVLVLRTKVTKGKRVYILCVPGSEKEALRSAPMGRPRPGDSARIISFGTKRAPWIKGMAEFGRTETMAVVEGNTIVITDPPHKKPVSHQEKSNWKMSKAPDRPPRERETTIAPQLPDPFDEPIVTRSAEEPTVFAMAEVGGKTYELEIPVNEFIHLAVTYGRKQA